MIEKKYQVTGMTCAACQANVSKTVSKLDGVDAVDVNLLSGTMKVSYDENRVTELTMAKAIQDIGYGMVIETGSQRDSFKSEWDKRKQQSEVEWKQMKQRLVLLLI